MAKSANISFIDDGHNRVTMSLERNVHVGTQTHLLTVKRERTGITLLHDTYSLKLSTKEARELKKLLSVIFDD